MDQDDRARLLREHGLIEMRIPVAPRLVAASPSPVLGVVESVAGDLVTIKLRKAGPWS